MVTTAARVLRLGPLTVLADNSPTKNLIVGLKNDKILRDYYEMSFGKRPVEELYKIYDDPDCINNLSNNFTYKKIKDSLWTKLKQNLTDQGDPRILGYNSI